MKNIKIAFRMILVMTIVTGFIYTLTVTGVAQIFFKDKANGSIITINGKNIGSSLIGQEFKNDKNFYSRPSSVNYNAIPSGATNLGPTSADLVKLVNERKAQGYNGEMLFTSGSGLDPDISPESALAQIDRIAKNRNFTQEEKLILTELVRKNITNRQFKIFGDQRVNVLQLNLELNRNTVYGNK